MDCSSLYPRSLLADQCRVCVDHKLLGEWKDRMDYFLLHQRGNPL